MASIKLHALRHATDFGVDSCDYRGDKFIGHDQGDEHSTVLEKDFGPTVTENKEIALVLELGPEFNQLLRQMTTPLHGIVPDAGFRIGVWDE